MKSSTIRILIILLIGAAAGFAIYFAIANRNQSSEDAENDSSIVNESSESDEDTNFAEVLDEDFLDENPTDHFLSSTPMHADSYAMAPVNVVIDTNAAIVSPSSLSIQKDGTEYGTGDVAIDADALVLRRTMNPDAPEGTYTVSYTLCTAADACQNGSFQFAIDPTLADFYDDQRNKSAVTIHISELSFEPIEVRISKGTTVTWINDEEVAHVITSDPQTLETFFPSLQSEKLLKGQSYSFTFTERGAYPYHDSEYPDDAVGTVVVQ